MEDADADRGAGDGGETEASVGGPHPFDPSSPLLESWDELMGDVAATAEIYREEGWGVLELHPDDVAAISDPGEAGLDVLVPGTEFERLESWVAEGRFEEYEVYRAETARVFLLVVARDEANRRVVCVPAHYGFDSASSLAERAEAAGRFLTCVRGPGGERVALTHDDPGPFLPGGGSGSGSAGGGETGEGMRGSGGDRTRGSGSGGE